VPKTAGHPWCANLPVADGRNSGAGVDASVRVRIKGRGLWKGRFGVCLPWNAGLHCIGCCVHHHHSHSISRHKVCGSLSGTAVFSRLGPRHATRPHKNYAKMMMMSVTCVSGRGKQVQTRTTTNGFIILLCTIWYRHTDGGVKHSSLGRSGFTRRDSPAHAVFTSDGTCSLFCKRPHSEHKSAFGVWIFLDLHYPGADTRLLDIAGFISLTPSFFARNLRFFNECCDDVRRRSCSCSSSSTTATTTTTCATADWHNCRQCHSGIHGGVNRDVYRLCV
jgi:hypothetical protein